MARAQCELHMTLLGCFVVLCFHCIQATSWNTTNSTLPILNNGTATSITTAQQNQTFDADFENGTMHNTDQFSENSTDLNQNESSSNNSTELLQKLAQDDANNTSSLNTETGDTENTTSVTNDQHNSNNNNNNNNNNTSTTNTNTNNNSTVLTSGDTLNQNANETKRNCSAEELLSMDANDRTNHCLNNILEANVTQTLHGATNTTRDNGPLSELYSNPSQSAENRTAEEVLSEQDHNSTENLLLDIHKHSNDTRGRLFPTVNGNGTGEAPLFWGTDEDEEVPTNTNSTDRVGSNETERADISTGVNGTRLSGNEHVAVPSFSGNSTMNGTLPELLDPEGTEYWNETLPRPSAAEKLPTNDTALNTSSSSTSLPDSDDGSNNETTTKTNTNQTSDHLSSTHKASFLEESQSLTTTSSSSSVSPKDDDAAEKEAFRDNISSSSHISTTTDQNSVDDWDEFWQESEETDYEDEDVLGMTQTTSPLEERSTQKTNGFWSGYRPHAVHGLIWEDKDYMLSVLVPIGCGITGALAIVCAAYTMRNCRRRKRQTVSASASPPWIAARRKFDQVFLLAESSDEE